MRGEADYSPSPPASLLPPNRALRFECEGVLLVLAQVEPYHFVLVVDT
jgi:hypothetical protein